MRRFVSLVVLAYLKACDLRRVINQPFRSPSGAAVWLATISDAAGIVRCLRMAGYNIRCRWHRSLAAMQAAISIIRQRRSLAAMQAAISIIRQHRSLAVHYSHCPAIQTPP